MSFVKIWASAVLGVALLGFASVSAYADDEKSCRFDGADLVCAENVRDGEAVMGAMANPKTMQMFKSSLISARIYATRQKREDFRLSLEANHKSMRKYVNRQWRKYRRRRLGEEAYMAIRKKYDAGVETYRAGLRLYRNDIWFDKRPQRKVKR